MAGTSKNSKKNSGRKGGKSSSGSRAGNQKKVPEEESSFIYTEVAIIASFAVAVLCFLSNFRLCGALGNVLRSVQLGVFGMIGYSAPILLFAGTCFMLANRGSRLAKIKMIAVIAGVVVLCGLAQMLFGGGYVSGMKIGEIYSRSGETGMGGGALGGIVVLGIGSVLGTVGTYLVLLVGLVICVVCITERSVVSAVKKGSGTAYRYAREDARRRHEIHKEKKEERKRLREEQRVRGVNLDSTKLEAWPEEEQEAEEAAAGDGYDDRSEAEEYEPERGCDSLEEYEPERDYSGPERYGPERDYGGPERYEPEEFDPEIGNQPFMKDLLPEDRDGGGWRRADLFAEGTAVRPPVPIDPEDDRVPFDEDDVFEERIAGGTAWATEKDRGDGLTGGYPEDGEVPEGGEYPEDGGIPESGEYPERSGIPESGEYPEEGEIPEGAGYPEDGEVPWNEEPGEPGENRAPWPEKKADDQGAVPGSGTFSVSGEGRRVVTANGKIIESDTEAVRKKLEDARRAAGEEKTAGAEKAVAPTLKQEAVKEYRFPPLSLLGCGPGGSGARSEKEYRETAEKLQRTLRDFGVGVTVTDVSCGPAVTRYELHPEQGVKVSKIVGLADDIKLSLAAADIRIEAPIPGKSAVGIEVPNKKKNIVYLREILESREFTSSQSKLTFAVGKDIAGQPVVTDIAKMPHLLIAGSTGSGKSVCINTLIMSILYKAHPDDVKLIMVDPKVVELSVYNGIPHLLIPVVTDPKKAAGALNWAVAEMENRYAKFSECNARDLKGYNAKVAAAASGPVSASAAQDSGNGGKPEKMPQLVIIIDELADLMMAAAGDVETAICRLAQKARAAGIHLVIATQRPSVDVITGLIKANVPSRIAFAVSSNADSRTILDMAGAEKLLGQGDMLLSPAGTMKPQRVQGAFVSDSEVTAVVDFLKDQAPNAEYSEEVQNRISSPASGGDRPNDRDEYFAQAGKFIIEKEKGSIGMLQRMFKIGFNRAARIMDQLAEAGVVSEEEGTKSRKVLMTMEEFDAMMNGGQE